MIGRASLVLFVALLGVACGCASSRDAEPPRSTVTATTRPVPAAVVAREYDAAWDAIQRTIRSRGYRVSVADYRNGFVLTEPLVSKQFFEVWRDDAVSAGDVAESSLGTVRRTLRFEITPTEDGRYAIAPHVRVERYALPERRITSAQLYRSAFRRAGARAESTTSRGVNPNPYWYDLGSDSELERALAHDLADSL